MKINIQPVKGVLSNKKLLFFALSVALLLGVAAAVIGPGTRKPAVDEKLKLANESILQNDTSGALVYAREALEASPDDMDALLLVASLSEKTDPVEAKRLYGRALDEFKKQDNPDVDGKGILTYWAAAGLAEDAGYKDQAIKYYQKVLDMADPGSSSQNDLMLQSRQAIKRLQ